MLVRQQTETIERLDEWADRTSFAKRFKCVFDKTTNDHGIRHYRVRWSEPPTENEGRIINRLVRYLNDQAHKLWLAAQDMKAIRFGFKGEEVEWFPTINGS